MKVRSERRPNSFFSFFFFFYFVAPTRAGFMWRRWGQLSFHRSVSAPEGETKLPLKAFLTRGCVGCSFFFHDSERTFLMAAAKLHPWALWLLLICEIQANRRTSRLSGQTIASLEVYFLNLSASRFTVGRSVFKQPSKFNYYPMKLKKKRLNPLYTVSHQNTIFHVMPFTTFTRNAFNCHFTLSKFFKSCFFLRKKHGDAAFVSFCRRRESTNTVYETQNFIYYPPNLRNREELSIRSGAAELFFFFQRPLTIF